MAKGETMIFIDDDATFIEPTVIETTIDIFNRFEASDNVKIIAYREQNYYSKEYSISTKNEQRKKQKEKSNKPPGLVKTSMKKKPK